jgi:hypothetical protein
MDSFIRMMILASIVGSAVALNNNGESKVLDLARKAVLAPMTRLSDGSVNSSAVSALAAQNSLATEADVVSADNALALKEDLDLDLREIKERRLVELINDPRANSAAKDDAIRFMNDYLRKLTEYMKLRNQELTALAEKNNG